MYGEFRPELAARRAPYGVDRYYRWRRFGCALHLLLPRHEFAHFAPYAKAAPPFVATEWKYLCWVDYLLGAY